MLSVVGPEVPAVLDANALEEVTGNVAPAHLAVESPEVAEISAASPEVVAANTSLTGLIIADCYGGTPPTTSGIDDVYVLEDAANEIIDLHAAFEDAETDDEDMTYEVIQNTNPALFDSVSMDGYGGLVLDFASDAYGGAELTVRATDTDGMSVETSFTVDVESVNNAPVAARLCSRVPDSIRLWPQLVSESEKVIPFHVSSDSFSDNFWNVLEMRPWEKASCLDCPYAPLCQGGCRMCAYLQNDKDYASTYCKREFFDRVFPKFLECKYAPPNPHHRRTPNCVILPEVLPLGSEQV